MPGLLAQILLVEDNPADARLFREAMRETDIAFQLHVVQNGEAALDFLHQRDRFAGSPRPDLVLLDLNLPGKGGHEVLAEVKTDDRLRKIPVVVLSSSHAMGDVNRSYDLQANCFITKPSSFEEFSRIMRIVEHFWFHLVRLPSGDEIQMSATS